MQLEERRIDYRLGNSQRNSLFALVCIALIAFITFALLVDRSPRPDISETLATEQSDDADDGSVRSSSSEDDGRPTAVTSEIEDVLTSVGSADADARRASTTNGQTATTVRRTSPDPTKAPTTVPTSPSSTNTTSGGDGDSTTTETTDGVDDDDETTTSVTIDPGDDGDDGDDGANGEATTTTACDGPGNSCKGKKKGRGKDEG